MTHKHRGIISLLLALTIVTILTASISLLFQRIRITKQISQQNAVAQQAFQAAYSGLESWQYQLSVNGSRKDIPPNDPSKDWQCINGSVVSSNETCPNDLPRYKVICQTCGISSSRSPDDGISTNNVLRSQGQKIYKGNTVTRALEVEF